MNSQRHPRPTLTDLERARRKTVKDIIAPGLDILFVGINPGLYTAAIGHHFGRPGNRFWPALWASGLILRRLTPYDSADLLKYKIGITNLVSRATAREDELTIQEYRKGARQVRNKIILYNPKAVAFLGLGLYRKGFDEPKAAMGLRKEKIGNSWVWVFPNPSGLNAHFQVKDYARLFRQMKRKLSCRAETSRAEQKHLGMTTSRNEAGVRRPETFLLRAMPSRNISCRAETSRAEQKHLVPSRNISA